MEALTIIIPSNNRPELLRRSILYWSKQRFRVIVCDGSDESQDTWVKGLFAGNIEYFHSQSPFPQRIKIAAGMVDTRYSILLSDDEFYLPKALVECIDFLDKNEEYIAVGGVCVGFSPGNTRILGFTQYPEWIGRERIESSARDRVVAHMGAYTNYLSGSVTRSHVWKSIADLYASHELPIFALWELEMNLILSYCGKSKVLNNLMHFRSHGEAVPIRNNIPSLSTKNTLSDIWKSNRHLNLRKGFVSIVSDALEELSTCEAKDGSGKIAVENAIDAYCKCIQSMEKSDRFTGFVKKIIPDAIRKKLKYLTPLKRGRHLASDQKSLEEAIRDLEVLGIYVDRNDVGDVISSINDFHGYENRTYLSSVEAT